MDFISLLIHSLESGLGNPFAYLAAPVPLCLLPAFFIAGAMTALIPAPFSVSAWISEALASA